MNNSEFRGVPVSKLLLLLRHAESEKNVKNYHGHDPDREYPLTQAGREAAQSFASRLRARISLETVMSSASLSPIQTAEAIADAYFLQVDKRPQLHAVHMGVIAGLTDVEIESQYPKAFDELRRFEAGELHPSKLTIPGRESFVDFAERIARELSEISTKKFPIALVVHHSVLSMCLHVLTTLPGGRVEAAYKRYKFANLSTTLVSIDRQTSVWRVSEIAVDPTKL